jgi:asparagine synthase (glutamine-hydrolysing)
MVNALPVSTRNISFDYKAKRFLRGMRFDPYARHFAWIGGLDPLAQHGILTSSFLESCGDEVVFADVTDHLGRVEPRDEYDALSYLYSKLYMGDDILVKVDRASMAHGLEVRAPFLDHRVVDFVTRLPTSMKLNGFQMKVILKEMLRGRVPDEVIHRPKKGFGIPIAEWLKGPLLPWARDLLSSQQLRDDGIFDPIGVEKLLDQHLKGRADHRTALWSILVFQLWRQEYGR